MLSTCLHHLRLGRHRNCLVRTLHDHALAEVAPALHGRLVDIGCGRKPYRELVGPYVDEHVGVDHAETRHGTDAVDAIGSAYSIPAPDAAFDAALCTAVLEHLEEPEAALRECHRVLAPGGRAVYTVPFIWHVHEEPRDFFRYSEHGLRHLFTKSGFEIVRLQALSGFWVTFGQMLVYYLHRFDRGPLRWLRLVTALGLGIQAVAWGLDRIDRAERWTWMYLVVARKPGAAPVPCP